MQSPLNFENKFNLAILKLVFYLLNISLRIYLEVER